MSNQQYLEDVRSNLMRMDVEELEERKKKGMFDDDVMKIVDDVISHKNKNPEEVKEEKKVSPITRRIVAVSAVGLVVYLYLWLKKGGKKS